MSSASAVEQDVGLAKRLAASFSSSVEESTLPMGELRRRSVVVCNPLWRHNGACSVKIRFERPYVNGGSRSSGSSSSSSKQNVNEGQHVVLCVDWEVVFGLSYPAETCAWHLMDDRGSYSYADVACRRAKLRPFVLEGVLSRIEELQKSFGATCEGSVGTDSGYYAFSSRDPARVSTRAMSDAPNPLAEASLNLKKQCGSSGGGGNSSSNSTASPFLSEFAFLCSWWAALELDDGCIIPPLGAVMRDHASMSSMTALDDDNSGSFPRQGRGTHFLDDVNGTRVQRPRRDFAAIFMPHGGVLAWGLWWSAEDNRSDAEMSAEVTAGSARMPSFSTIRSGVSSYRTGGAVNRSHTGSTESAEPQGTYSQQQQRPRQKCQALRMTTARGGGVPGTVLPSVLVAANILHTEVYQLSDVCLCDDDPCEALRKNARICREGKALRGVSTALRVLRHIVKGASPHATSLYALQLAAPALHEVVKAMQAQRQPFWAGVAICCLMLPAILSDRPLLLDLAPHLIDPVECYRCVTLVATVFSVVGAAIKFREAEVAKKAIENAYRASKLPTPVACGGGSRSGGGSTTTVDGSDGCNSKNKNNNGGAAAPEGHPPITECAVCGLLLLRNTTRPVTTAFSCGTADIDDSVGGCRVSLRFASEDGCLTVQCARCGHGGHLAHIIAWWDDESVRCCPKGCNCLCIY
ncbi:hypothetical protein DQ04_05311020 [Trypanosoma grayi]|uniref:hypothetical protein n=1 Tax=Trypanosoma grayi TaxID=71804 RepID=UPI0004F44A3C|nr:hypothetical protein DQ04_05311020 [Trypanosoma grayi]KEG09383.1 hypothetical protein DQ04_05311020 [Trypanosoma grayi]